MPFHSPRNLFLLSLMLGLPSHVLWGASFEYEMLGPPVGDQTRYSPRYGMPYQDYGFSPAGISGNLENERASYLNATLGYLKAHRVNKGTVDTFTKYAGKMIHDPNDIGRQIDLAYEVLQRHWASCGGWAAQTAAQSWAGHFYATAEPSTWYECGTTAGCAWIGGLTAGNRIFAANMYVGHLENPAHAYLNTFYDLIKWEMGNAFGIVGGYYPNTVDQEIGSQSPCGHPRTRARNSNVATHEDIPIHIKLNVINYDRDPLAYSVKKPAHGKLKGRAPNLVYYPDHEFTGVDNIVFQINTGEYKSNGRVSVRVLPVVDHPIAVSQHLSTKEDVALKILLKGKDRDKDITYKVVGHPVHGKLTGKAPHLIYIPSKNFHGSDQFPFQVVDEKATSTGLIRISVLAVNDPPIAKNERITAYEDHPVHISLLATDVDHDTLHYKIMVPPSHGKISGTGANLQYLSEENYNGNDSFIYQVSDGKLASQGHVSIKILPVNDPPIAIDEEVQTEPNKAVGIVLTATDADHDPLKYQELTQPLHGSLSGKVPNLHYTPARDYVGEDSFKFEVSDGKLTSTGQVSITVQKMVIKKPGPLHAGTQE